MGWCNDPDEEEERGNGVISPTTISITTPKPNSTQIRNITCPSCGHNIQFQDQGGINELPGLPAGMKFDPNDQEILEHLEAKVVSDHHVPNNSNNNNKLHPLIDEFISTLEGENGICYTHPEKLPGVSKDGQIRHFFHRPSKAYTTGTRKRRKVHTDEEGSETRWHKTGKTRPVLNGGEVKGFKKILVLYTNYGRQKKPEKTNWVMHQYHLGTNEEEKDGELVLSKVFYQTQPRQCGNINNTNSIIIKDPYDESMVPKNAVPLDYYNAHNNFINNYEHHHVGHDDDNRESSSPQLIPNLVVQGGDHGSSFFRFAMDHGNNRARLERNK